MILSSHLNLCSNFQCDISGFIHLKHPELYFAIMKLDIEMLTKQFIERIRDS